MAQLTSQSGLLENSFHLWEGLSLCSTLAFNCLDEAHQHYRGQSALPIECYSHSKTPWQEPPK